MLVGLRICVCLLMLLACLSAGSHRAVAQDSSEDQPVVVFSIANVDRLVDDVKYIARLVGNPFAGGVVEGFLDPATEGLDRSRPLGFVVTWVEEMPVPLGFVPTSDIEGMLRGLAPFLGEPKRLDAETLSISSRAVTVYIRQYGEWAYISTDQDVLAYPPQDPSDWLAGMDEIYDLGMRVNFAALSEELRAGMLDSMEEGAGLQTLDGEDADPTEQMEQVQRRKEMEDFLAGVDYMQFGWGVDKQGQRILVDVSFVTRADSKYAEALAAHQPIPSRFASLIQPEDAFFFHVASSISSQFANYMEMNLWKEITDYKEELVQHEELDDAKRDLQVYLAEQAVDIVCSVMKTGKFDAGMTVLTTNNELNAVGGMVVEDGERITQCLTEVAEMLETEGIVESKPRFRFAGATYKGVILHAVEFDIVSESDASRLLFGNTGRLLIGVAPDCVYMAFGRQAAALLRGLIDSGQTPSQPPMHLLQWQTNEAAMAGIADIVRSSTGGEKFVSSTENTKMQMQFTPMERGIRWRLSIGGGVIENFVRLRQHAKEMEEE